MKKNRTAWYSLAALTIACIAGFHSCSKKAECETCKQPNPDLIKPISYVSKNNTIQLNDTYVWAFNKEDMRQHAESFYESINAFDFLDDVKNNLPDDPILMVLYLNKLIMEDGTFTPENIKGVSVFNLSGNLINHTFFNRNNERLQKVETLSLKVPLITNNALEYIRENIVFRDARNTTVLGIAFKKNIDYETPNKTDYLRRIAIKYHNGSLSENLNLQSKSEKAIYDEGIEPADEGSVDICNDKLCGAYMRNALCLRDLSQMYPATWHCVKTSGGSGGGGGGSCARDEYKTNIEKAGAMDESKIQSTFNDKIHYGIKDFLLAKSAGKKYVNFYYQLSDVYKDKVSIDLMLNSASLLYEMNNKLDMLLSPAGYEKEIFLTSEMRASLLKLFTSYKAIYTDEYIDSIFSNIEADLNWAENKTVEEVIKGLE